MKALFKKQKPNQKRRKITRKIKRKKKVNIEEVELLTGERRQ